MMIQKERPYTQVYKDECDFIAFRGQKQKTWSGSK
jgi:hypothetical protein